MFLLNASSSKNSFLLIVVVSSIALLDSNDLHANPGIASSVGIKASVSPHNVARGPFAVPELLRDRVDFWKDIFTKYGAGHSVIHHRDFPQIVLGVIDLQREYHAMSKGAFDSYKNDVVKKTLEDVKRQLLELANGSDARSAFQERALEQLARRKLPRSVLQTWVQQDLIRTQTGIRERYSEAIRRSWRYLPVMEQIFVQEFGLPKELTRMPFIESSFDYTAYSSVGAAGIWQFMPRTARAHRMLVGRYVDERRDPVRATRAAAEYLRSAFNSLGAWPLAITSYNHGVGGVRQKIKKAGTSDLASIIEDPNERFFGFASTNFYPEFLAAVEIANDYRLYFPEVREEPPLQVISYPLRRAISASTVASRLGISLDELKEANYGLLNPVWQGRVSIPSGYTLRVPISFKERADKVFGGHGGGVLKSNNSAQIVPVQASLAGTSHVVKRGDTLSGIAKRYGMSISELQRINNLRTTNVRSGQRLRVRGVSASAGTSKQGVRRSSRSVTVRSGDTLGRIAKRERVAIRDIKSLNGIRGSTIFAGQKLKLP